MRARTAGQFPPMNMFLDDDAVLINLELPGNTFTLKTHAKYQSPARSREVAAEIEIP